MGSGQGGLETARSNRSTLRKPIPRSRAAGRAAIVSRDRHSFTRIRIPAGSLPSSATRPKSSARSLDRKFQIFLASIVIGVADDLVGDRVELCTRLLEDELHRASPLHAIRRDK